VIVVSIRLMEVCKCVKIERKYNSAKANLGIHRCNGEGIHANLGKDLDIRKSVRGGVRIELQRKTRFLKPRSTSPTAMSTNARPKCV
jgi:hypothetical protein